MAITVQRILNNGRLEQELPTLRKWLDNNKGALNGLLSAAVKAVRPEEEDNFVDGLVNHFVNADSIPKLNAVLASFIDTEDENFANVIPLNHASVVAEARLDAISKKPEIKANRDLLHALSSSAVFKKLQTFSSAGAYARDLETLCDRRSKPQQIQAALVALGVEMLPANLKTLVDAISATNKDSFAKAQVEDFTKAIIQAQDSQIITVEHSDFLIDFLTDNKADLTKYWAKPEFHLTATELQGHMKLLLSPNVTQYQVRKAIQAIAGDAFVDDAIAKKAYDFHQAKLTALQEYAKIAPQLAGCLKLLQASNDVDFQEHWRLFWNGKAQHWNLDDWKSFGDSLFESIAGATSSLAVREILGDILFGKSGEITTQLLPADEVAKLQVEAKLQLHTAIAPLLVDSLLDKSDPNNLHWMIGLDGFEQVVKQQVNRSTANRGEAILYDVLVSRVTGNPALYNYLKKNQARFQSICEKYGAMDADVAEQAIMHILDDIRAVAPTVDAVGAVVDHSRAQTRIALSGLLDDAKSFGDGKDEAKELDLPNIVVDEILATAGMVKLLMKSAEVEADSAAAKVADPNAKKTERYAVLDRVRASNSGYHVQDIQNYCTNIHELVSGKKHEQPLSEQHPWYADITDLRREPLDRAKNILKKLGNIGSQRDRAMMGMITKVTTSLANVRKVLLQGLGDLQALQARDESYQRNLGSLENKAQGIPDACNALLKETNVQVTQHLDSTNVLLEEYKKVIAELDKRNNQLLKIKSEIREAIVGKEFIDSLGFDPAVDIVDYSKKGLGKAAETWMQGKSIGPVVQAPSADAPVLSVMLGDDLPKSIGLEPGKVLFRKSDDGSAAWSIARTEAQKFDTQVHHNKDVSKAVAGMVSDVMQATKMIGRPMLLVGNTPMADKILIDLMARNVILGENNEPQVNFVNYSLVEPKKYAPNSSAVLSRVKELKAQVKIPALNTAVQAVAQELESAQSTARRLGG